MSLPRSIALGLAASSFAGVVLAGGAAPPSGWERSPAPAVAPSGSAPVAACCASDSTCCERQLLIDRRAEPVPSSALTFQTRDLPEAIVRKSPAPGPGIDGAPPLRFVDGRGQPPPWKDGPYGELRVMPPGVFGDISRGDFFEPCFEPPELRSQGYGVTLATSEDGRRSVPRPYRFHALSPGPHGTITYDYVEGELDASQRSTVRTWVHADTRDLARGVLFAFRQDDDGVETVHLVLPEVILGNTTAGVNVSGGFDATSRFSRSWSFTEYALNASPGAGESATFMVTDTQVRTLRALDVPLEPEAAKGLSMGVDVSRTSTESTARLRIHLFEPTLP